MGLGLAWKWSQSTLSSQDFGIITVIPVIHEVLYTTLLVIQSQNIYTTTSKNPTGIYICTFKLSFKIPCPTEPLLQSIKNWMGPLTLVSCQVELEKILRFFRPGLRGTVGPFSLPRPWSLDNEFHVSSTDGWIASNENCTTGNGLWWCTTTKAGRLPETQRYELKD